MKKIILLSFTVFLAITGFGQTVAQDWTKTDCNGNSWHLFDELNNQKVIIIEFVMPCSSCTVGGNTLDQIYQEYNFNYPGRILSFAIADNNSTSCNTMTSWVNTNGFSFTPFNNGSSICNYYGGPGMPTVVVLGGGYNHTVFYRKVSFYGPSEDANVRAAMDSALFAANSVNDNPSLVSALSLFPNPSSLSSSINYSLTKTADVTISIFNFLGENVKELFSGLQNPGQYESKFDCSELPEGVYFVRLDAGEARKAIRLTVIK